MNSGYYDFDYVEDFPSNDGHDAEPDSYWARLRESYLSRCADNEGLLKFARYAINHWIEQNNYPEDLHSRNIKLFVDMPPKRQIMETLGIKKHRIREYLITLEKKGIIKRDYYSSHVKMWDKKTKNYLLSKNTGRPLGQRVTTIRLIFNKEGIVPPHIVWSYSLIEHLFFMVHVKLESHLFGVRDIFELASDLLISEASQSESGQHKALSYLLSNLEGQVHGGLKLEYMDRDTHTNVKLWRVIKIAPRAMLDTPPIGVTKTKALNHTLEVWLLGWYRSNPDFDMITSRELIELFERDYPGEDVHPIVMGRAASKVLGRKSKPVRTPSGVVKAFVGSNGSGETPISG